MKNIFSINGLTKQYKSFDISNICFSCPEGSIMGLIGPNGAGKTTTIKAMMGLLNINAGNIEIFGKKISDLTKEDKESIAVVYDTNSLPEHLTAKKINNIFKRIYKNWCSDKFYHMIERLQIPSDTSIKNMSKGNKMKINLVVALAHNPRLLILDEITGVLDPIMRNDIMQLFLEFVQDEHRSNLFSTHITTDLEKIADYITFINRGRVVFSKDKDELICNYKLIHCRASKFDEINKTGIIAYKEEKNRVDFIYDCSVCKNFQYSNDVVIEDTSIEDIMLILTRGHIL